MAFKVTHSNNFLLYFDHQIFSILNLFSLFKLIVTHVAFTQERQMKNKKVKNQCKLKRECPMSFLNIIRLLLKMNSKLDLDSYPTASVPVIMRMTLENSCHNKTTFQQDCALHFTKS